MVIVAVDSSSGSVYVSGLASAALDGQVYAGAADIALFKFSATGEWLWTRLRGTIGGDFGYAGKVLTDFAW